MNQKTNEQESRRLLLRIKKMMKEKEMRWRDASDFFGMESSSTIHNWFTKKSIPRNQHKFVDLFLKRKKY